MKKKFLIHCALIVALPAQSQHADFENPVLATGSAWYGQDQVIDGDTIYANGGFHFETNYNSGWGSFAGWAISNVTDNTTPGWANQYSAVTGVGQNGSSQYGICYASAWNNHRVFTLGAEQVLQGFYVTNTTYAYYAMLNGDSFTKPFGADTNAQGLIDGTNGEDWFLLTVYGLDADSLYTGDSVNFFLADFRFSNDAEDYILDEWTYVDLSSLGAVKGLDFVLTSTDTTGGFGMNNPAYFAMDNLLVAYSGIVEPEQRELVVYPNPTSGMIHLCVPQNSDIKLYSSNGKMLTSFVAVGANPMLDLSEYETGIYFMTATSDGTLLNTKVIKH